MPVEVLWQEGLALSSLFKLPSDPWILVKGELILFRCKGKLVGLGKRDAYMFRENIGNYLDLVKP